MVDIVNKNPPLAEENFEETVKRLEKTKNKIERSSTIIKGLGLALPLVAGIAWTKITGNNGMTELSALAAFPVVTAVVATHALVRDTIERKIDSLKKKIAGSSLISSMSSKQKLRLKLEKQFYTVFKQTKGFSSVEDKERAIQRIEKEKQRAIIFSKAAELAKQEGKEKAIGRLMDIAEKNNNGKTFKYTVGGALQSLYALFVTPGALDMISQKNNPVAIACGAAAAVTIPAIAYCAAKTVQSIKRSINADRAFETLKRYVNERS